MKELRFSGSDLGSLRTYLEKEYSGVEHIKVVKESSDIFVSEQLTRGYFTSMHNVGCFIIYSEKNPNECNIKIVAAGGGYGVLNTAGKKVRNRTEEKVHEDIFKYARELRLKEEIL